MPTKKTTKTKQPLYDWQDGKGKVHTIPKNIHAQNMEAKGYGINLNAPTSAPLSNRQAYGLAQQSADLEYQPQIQAVQSMQRSVPEWYANYQAQVAGQQAALKAYSDPMLQQAQQGVQNAGAMTAPGLDPSSPQYATEQKAAAGRQSIAQLGYDTLAAVPAAGQAYLGGQASVAGRELPQVQAMYGQQLGQLQGQRGAAVANAYGQIRGNEQNAQIAYSTLDLNRNRAAADVDLERGIDPVTRKPLPQEAPTGYGPGAPGLNKYGYTADEWSQLSPKEQAKERKGTDTAAAKKAEEDAAAKKKKRADIDKATGKVRNSVTDVIDYLQEQVGQMGEDKSGKPDINGNYPRRKITQADIDRAKVGKYGTMGKIAIAVRDGKPLTQGQIDYLHQRDPNFRVPREWMAGKPQTDAQKKDPHGTGEANDRAPGGYGHI